MPLDPGVLTARRPFDRGFAIRGREDLAAVSVSHRLTGDTGVHGRVLATNFGDLLVSRLRADGLTVERTGTLLDDAYADYLQVAVVTSGTVLSEHGRAQRTTPSDAAWFLDSGVAYRAHFVGPAESIHVYMPADAARAHGIRRDAVVARSGGTTASMRILGRILQAVTSGVDEPSAASRMHIGVALRELTLASLHEAVGRDGTTYDAKAAHRLRAHAAIADRFVDPDFNVTALASSLRMSVRYVHMLFEDQESGAGGLLRETRLARAAQLLADEAWREATIAGVAAASGFRGADSFSRAFTRAHGMTPSDFRVRSRDGDRVSGSGDE